MSGQCKVSWEQFSVRHLNLIASLKHELRQLLVVIGNLGDPFGYIGYKSSAERKIPYFVLGGR